MTINFDSISSLDNPELTIDQLYSPCLVLDKQIFTANVRRFIELSSNSARPKKIYAHIKTLKSFALARLAIELGFYGIAVARAVELISAVRAGFNEIIVSYPIVDEKDFRALREVPRGANVTLTVDSIDQLNLLQKNYKSLKFNLSLNIEVDSGLARLGVRNNESFISLLEWLERKIPNVHIGISTYFGQAYQTRLAPNDTAQLSEAETVVSRYKSLLQNKLNQPVNLTVGASPVAAELACSSLYEKLVIGAGLVGDGSLINYYGYTEANCAATVLATVLSKHKNTTIFNAGWKSIGRFPQDIHGQQVFAMIKSNGSKIHKCNEEVSWIEGDLALTIGDKVEFFPMNASACIHNFHEFFLKQNEVFLRLPFDFPVSIR